MDNTYTKGIGRFGGEAIFKDGVEMFIAEIISELNKYQDISETRPIVEHNHSPGPWRKDKDSPYHLNDANHKCVGLFVKTADLKYCKMTPELVQIAEMYFDYMKSNNMTDSLPFALTSDVLNKLNK